jgi:hypothetical protein
VLKAKLLNAVKQKITFNGFFINYDLFLVTVVKFLAIIKTIVWTGIHGIKLIYEIKD